MTRVFGDPVEVRVTGGRPDGFAWRGRRYAVRRVLEHWVTTRDWWLEREPDADEPGEREYWRVEAVAGGGEPGVYELRHDSAADAWTLSRLWD